MYDNLNIVSSEQKMLFDIRQLLIEINSKLSPKQVDIEAEIETDTKEFINIVEEKKVVKRAPRKRTSNKGGK